MSLFRTILYFILLFLLSGSLRQFSAQEYRSDYVVEYFINRSAGNLSTRVNFTVKTTNLRSDVFVKKFSLSFPKNFEISNLKARDDEGSITPKIIQSDQSSNIELEFTKPKLGKESSNTLTLEFDQSNLFQINGNVWEVILPTIGNRGEGTYQMIVNLPDNKKKISIAKPKPDKIEGNKIIWNNPPGKIVYAVFGSTQMYELNLTYTLQNTKLTPIYSEVAFPPDTTYQKSYVRGIEPLPQSMYLDEDGNYIGRYYLKPKETKVIQFSGTTQLFINPRDEVKIANLTRLKEQEKYLLNQADFWRVSNPEKFKQLKTPEMIYDFIVQNFKYNFNRVVSNKSFGRLGADTALKRPDQAICVEFTDSFVTLAREQGIMSREIQGFAVTQNPSLRPLSLIRDVLHSWPEYFDPSYQNWIQIDPTWENTSGIDYFSSFDLNHIAFVIHGKNSSRPLPAGMYKITDSQDVIVRAVNAVPKENKKLRITDIKIDKSLNDTTPTKGVISIKNEGNVYLYNVPVQTTGENLEAKISNSLIDSIAPYEEKKINLLIKSVSRNQYEKASLSVTVGNFDKKAIELKVTPYSYSVSLWIGILIVVVFGGLTLFIRGRKRRRA